jgi:hypothetical protein
VEDVERAISSMFAVVDRLHLLTSAQINVLVSADREAAIPAMQGQVLIDLREHGGRLASNVMAPVAVPGHGVTNRCARHCRPRAACWSCGGWRAATSRCSAVIRRCPGIGTWRAGSSSANRCR